ncbi:hypothetical protein CCACVL1_17357 [Corchorus capsularis]|uniref:CCHC-type domain-containing protein n=1 Tax=Corchorus capsularis TaxID=210143 RepID=A0A1R3HSG7_COCAP|nr:hypothetical protein CCACVL1_17357 [Corchorus capsularis]
MVLHFEEPEGGEPEDIVGELDVLELDTNDAVNKQVRKHSLVGKIVSDKVVKLGPLRAIIAKAWPLREMVEIYELEVSTFLFIFKDERDKFKVLKQGPWSIMDCHIMLKEWPEEATLEEIDFTSSEIWVQVHGLPFSYLTRENAIKIGSMFPRLVELDFEPDEQIRWNGFLRMKVQFKFNVEDPLKTGFNLKRKDNPSKRIDFRYERLPEFCYHCGRLGHPAKGCCFQHDGRKKDSYGHWLRAIPVLQKTQKSSGSKSQHNLFSWRKEQGAEHADNASLKGVIGNSSKQFSTTLPEAFNDGQMVNVGANNNSAKGAAAFMNLDEGESEDSVHKTSLKRAREEDDLESKKKRRVDFEAQLFNFVNEVQPNWRRTTLRRILTKSCATLSGATTSQKLAGGVKLWFDKIKPPPPRDFKFESKWLMDRGCHDTIKEAWESEYEGSRMFKVSQKLKNTRKLLRYWRKNCFPNPRVEVDKLLQRLKEV